MAVGSQDNPGAPASRFHTFSIDADWEEDIDGSS